MNELGRTLGWWTVGLCRRRTWEVFGAAVSVALAVSFVLSMGAFTASSQANLTTRAAKGVVVDWQVQLTPQGSSAAVSSVLHRVRGVRAVLPVAYARVPSMTSASGGVVRTTGAGDVVSLPKSYTRWAPGWVRYLLGGHEGVLLQQQTAANLAAVPGSVIIVHTPGRDVPLRVAGVVDLPGADSFFQVVGAPSGAGAAAPPDNVVIVPPSLFGTLTTGATVIHQFHVLLDHRALPSDPAVAANTVSAEANHVEAAVAGGALVGDNLYASLSSAREDALYAQLLLLLLGVPGLVLAVVVAALVTGLRGERRKRESGLLLLRGASVSTVAILSGAESVVTAAIGVGLGLAAGALVVRATLGPATGLPTAWVVGAAVIGLVLAGATQIMPSVRAASRFGAESVAESVTGVGRQRLPWPLRAGLDVIFLAGAAVAFALTARSGYQVVVVPEGVAVTSVNYAALLGPALAWPGLVLLVWRLTVLVAARRNGRSLPHAPGSAPELVAAAVRRRKLVIARGAAALAAALGLGVSTAVFTATYDHQSSIDVALTVGSDVAAVPRPGTPASPSLGASIAAAPAVQGVEPLVHRFAYVGPDLQDLFGIRPATFASSTSLQDSFVPGSTVAGAMHALTTTPDGVLLSAETLRDYQLHPGDLIRLRLPVGPAGTYQAVPFHVVGQVSEFPTAPKDSFIVANGKYVDRVTRSDTVSAFLVHSSNPTKTATALRAQLGNGWQIHDVVSGRNGVTTASGLAATDLGGLARLELGFAVVFALACSALALALGVAQRRRALVLLAVLGATPRQRGRFLGAEGRTLIAAGLVGGAAIGAVIGYMLVKVLNGIFDPPPDHLIIPLRYVFTLVVTVVLIAVAVVAGVGRLAARAGSSQLRDL